jgi:hypothetical protein
MSELQRCGLLIRGAKGQSNGLTRHFQSLSGLGEQWLAVGGGHLAAHHRLATTSAEVREFAVVSQFIDNMRFWDSHETSESRPHFRLNL